MIAMASESGKSPNIHLSDAIGMGTFGVVYKGHLKDFDEEDESASNEVAVKQIRLGGEASAFRCLLREIRILASTNHPNVLHLTHISYTGDFYYLVTELCCTDLATVIQSGRLHDSLGSEDFLSISSQIFSGLAYLHKASIIHRDIKPANILIDRKMGIKIADFGSARGLRDSVKQSNGGLTEYIVTRWYRAPEIITTTGAYSTAVDVWSTGCVIAELVTRKALFPGRSEIDQMDLFAAFLGQPISEKMRLQKGSGKNADLFTKRSSSSQNPRRQCPLLLAEKVKTSPLTRDFSADLLDLLASIFVYNPSRRITCRAALKLKMFDAFQTIGDAEREVKPIPLRDIEACPQQVKDLKRALKAEIKRIRQAKKGHGEAPTSGGVVEEGEALGRYPHSLPPIESTGVAAAAAAVAPVETVLSPVPMSEPTTTCGSVPSTSSTPSLVSPLSSPTSSLNLDAECRSTKASASTPLLSSLRKSKKAVSRVCAKIWSSMQFGNAVVPVVSDTYDQHTLDTCAFEKCASKGSAGVLPDDATDCDMTTSSSSNSLSTLCSNEDVVFVMPLGGEWEGSGMTLSASSDSLASLCDLNADNNF